MQFTPEMVTGVLAGLIGPAIYAISVVIYRSQSQEIRPIAVSAIKMWSALPLMMLLVINPFRTTSFSVPMDMALILALSLIIGAVIGDTLYLMSQEMIGVSRAFPITCISPIFTNIMAIIFLSELILPLRIIGTFVAVAGAVIISREKDHRNTELTPTSNYNLGLVLAIITAFLYATGSILLQIGVTNVDPIDASFVRVLVGSIAFIPIFVIAKHNGMPVPSKVTVKKIAIAGFFGMGIASLLYVLAVKFVGAAVSSVLASTSPLFAISVSVVYLKEYVSRKALIGIFATIIGVILVVLGG
jgi:drug/metabolite transporter (DMT)-like permease